MTLSSSTFNASPVGQGQENIHPTLHHVNLKTTKLQEMVVWYGVVLGTRVLFQYPFGAWLSNDEANHRLAFLAVPGLSDDAQKEQHTGLHHFAFEFTSFDALMNTYVRLRQAGITPAACLDHGMTLSMYYTDPDGNGVELQVDTFGDWRQSSEWMQSKLPTMENPLGTYFDPEQVFNAWNNESLSFEEIHRRAYSGQYLPDPLPPLK
jgi:catechol-2,3-dioxygenase